MAITNSPNPHSSTRLPSAQPQRNAQGLHDYEEPTPPSLKETLIELAMTALGVVGVFFLIIALVKAYA